MYERSFRPDELMHYGVLGMKWGVRRYQNPDGTLTAKGKARLKDVDYDESTSSARKTQRSLNHLSKQKAKMDAEVASMKKEADKREQYVKNLKRVGDIGFYDPDREIAKEQAKYKAAVAKGKEYAKRSSEINAMMTRTIQTAVKKGQKAESKKISQYMYSGKQLVGLYAASYTLGLPGYAGMAIATKAANPERQIERNRYKVGYKI